MLNITRVSNVSNLRSEMSNLVGKRIQVVTTNGRHIRGTVKSVGKDFVVIHGQSFNGRGERTSSSSFFPFFFPFTSLLFFSPFFFPFF